MSGRTGLRRARVLLALTEQARSVAALAGELHLPWSAVNDICVGLCGAGLAHIDTRFYLVALTAAPHVAQAQAEARALLEARGVEA